LFDNYIYSLFDGGLGAAALVGLTLTGLLFSGSQNVFMVTTLLTAALYFLIRKKYWWVLIFRISCLTFYGSVFFMAAIGIYLLIGKNKEL